MAESTIRYTLNINSQATAGKSGVRTEEVTRDLTYMRNLIIENAAFQLVLGKERELTQSIDRTFRAIVEKELTTMGRKIASLIFVPDSRQSVAARGSLGVGRAYSPRGTLSIEGNVSAAMQGLVSPVRLSDGTGYWPARNAKYLKRQRKLSGGRWFQVTGELKQTLRQASTYTQAYGPIKVEYTKAKRGDTGSKNLVVNVSKMSSGVGGRRSTTITFGNVSISALGTITSDQLGDPSRRQPSAWSTGLFESLPDDVERKLLNREDAYRPFLEQFLAFYLTRAIPNAVFRRIEEIMDVRAVGYTKMVGTRKGANAKRFSKKNLATIVEQLKPLTQG